MSSDPKIVIPRLNSDAGIIICIGCGCSDFDADGRVEWCVVNEEAGVGLCTACAKKPLEELMSTWRQPK
jgi:hypothetical protein